MASFTSRGNRATTTSTRRDSHSTTTGQGGWSTRRIAVSALFVAAAMVLSFVEVPIFPAAPYLKYDPSGIIVLVAGFAFGPATGAVVGTLMWLPHFFGNPFGALMGVIANLAMVIPAAAIYRARPTRAGSLMGMGVGLVCFIVACILMNLVITPLYAPGTSVSDVAQLIVPVLLPFNLLKGLINCAITQAVYKTVSKLVGD